ncbi:hypothetical protein LINPERHAP1_LOCUS36274, partial [Linum perenne]
MTSSTDCRSQLLTMVLRRVQSQNIGSVTSGIGIVPLTNLILFFDSNTSATAKIQFSYIVEVLKHYGIFSSPPHWTF